MKLLSNETREYIPSEIYFGIATTKYINYVKNDKIKLYITNYKKNMGDLKEDLKMLSILNFKIFFSKYI